MAVISVQEDGGGDFVTPGEALADAGTGDNDEINIEGAWDDADTTAWDVVDDNITVTALTGSKHIGRPHAGAETTYRLRTTSAAAVSVTISNTGVTIDGLDIQQTSTDTSDEVFRATATNPTFKNCVLGFASRNSEQDIFYYATNTESTINFENCHFYNVYRGVVDLYDVDATVTINFNSCTGYDIGFSAVRGNRSGLAGVYQLAVQIYNVNIFNCAIHINTGFVVDFTTAATGNLSVDRSITNVAAWETGADVFNDGDNIESATFTEDPEVAGVIVVDVDSTFDLRLQDDADNIAQDAHGDANMDNEVGGQTITMPATDLIGTERPQNTNYDIGAFEIVAAAEGPTMPVFDYYYNQSRL